ncbi:hypothetical protein M011DRAFT_488435 [Sporormia fimetaria CBS 119925]|uniref:Gryzun putative trafficking through Golgi domain-containing protein n=1 Tax=Sporormia fimetaria CBS 119925 TaxID=1340428 RepID=A0A6A6V7C4_9PLEO|nr:hypothetical protein M011DRAFT_488435 [Sporormia fimetaria CBS 119925]
MEAYPREYTQHNLPLLVLSGLATDVELEAPPSVQEVFPGHAITTISSELPHVTGERAQQLLQEFRRADGSDAPWNGRASNRRGSSLDFRIRAVGREFKLPPRKADPPAQSSTTPPSSPTITPSWVLHSPVSPLTPSSSIFPDGLMAPAWLAKHQDYVPSVFISFFAFDSDPTKNTLNDNQLKTEISKIKSQIHKSDYKTRFAVVLLSNKTVLEAPDMEERLMNIRRATGLDPKNGLFFLPPNTSPVELRSFALSVTASLSAPTIDYYRDLTKHARRKKARGNVPPPTAPPTRGNFHLLSQTGWNVRYDFKLGVFAEFRQEMDAAQRHYESALESLFGGDGVFETTASWSPRWDEIRLIADTIALRLIRCHLWNSYSTSAVQAWLRYKETLRDLLDRRGKGSSNYGWEAWESRWAQIMAQLIQRAELPTFRIRHPAVEPDLLSDETHSIFALPEKQFPVGERLHPWELLHHPGYWYKLSAEHAKRRYVLAREIPEEDRTPPGMSPATRVSSRNQTYDYYLVPEPHEEVPIQGAAVGFQHWKDIVGKLNSAVPEFEARGQLRKVEQLQLEVCRSLLHSQEYEALFPILRPLWETMSWRQERWYDIASEVLWALHECALRVQDRETYILTEWELYSPVFRGKPRYKHDLMTCLHAFPESDSTPDKPSISFKAEEFSSCLTTGFTFAKGEGNVGEPLHAQIVITSTARSGSLPITLSTLTFQFKGCLDAIRLAHTSDGSETAGDTMSDLVLDESTTAPHKPSWSGQADLQISAGQTKIYSFPVIFREAGDVSLVSSCFELNTKDFDLTCTDIARPHEENARPTWWLRTGSTIKSRRLNRDSGTIVKVLPKPPKMELSLPDIRPQYYTDENVSLAIEVTNQEDEDTEAVLEVRLLGKDTLAYSWVGKDSSSNGEEPSAVEGSDIDLPGHVIGRLAQGAKVTEKIQFKAPPDPSDYALEVKVLYHVLSDRDIPISKIISTELIFNSAFEASYEFVPRFHPEPWPSFFNMQKEETDGQGQQSPSGITQRWHLKAKLASFADETLVVKDVTVGTLNVHGGAVCTIAKESGSDDVVLEPQQLTERSYCLDHQRTTLEERRATALDLNLSINWQRTNSADSSIVTSKLPIPRITIPSSEPRVLATALHSTTVPNVIHLDYILENPTMHFLTFELNMEASEEFGFSGSKLRNLQLLPMSRETVRFNVYPLVSGAWITPQLKVTDRYFNQTLKVVATDGLRADKKGVGVWVPEGDQGGANG